MFVDVELFSADPLDNVIACLKFRFDKVIFFGDATESMDAVACATVQRFLQSERIGVQEVQFVQLTDSGYPAVEQELTAAVQREQAAGNTCFIDITGGGELALAAVGMVSTRQQVPLMMVDIDEDEVQLLAYPEQFDQLPSRNVYLRLEEFLHLQEGLIDWSRHKSQNEQIYSPEFAAYIVRLKQFIDRMGPEWNKVAMGLANLSSGQQLQIERVPSEIKRAAKVAHLNVPRLLACLEKLHRKHLLQDYVYDDFRLRFTFNSELEKELLCDCGAVLEHYVYCKVMARPEVDDCGIGYFLDWEGEGDPAYHTPDGEDVINEIDVVYMSKNIPTFISCKNKQVTTNQPLYELDTVADRFGGVHVHKVLFASGGVSPAVRNRAAEMGIRVVRR